MDSTKPKKSIEKMTVIELRKELKRRKLRITGSKDVQLQRLRDDDKAQIAKKKEEDKEKEKRKIKVFNVNRKLIAHISPSEFYARKQELMNKGGHTYRSGLDREDNFFIRPEPESSSDFFFSEDEDIEERKARHLREYNEYLKATIERGEKIIREEREKEKEAKKREMWGDVRKVKPWYLQETEEEFGQRMVDTLFEGPIVIDKRTLKSSNVGYEGDIESDDEDY